LAASFIFELAGNKLHTYPYTHQIGRFQNSSDVLIFDLGGVFVLTWEPTVALEIPTCP
jgi:hypothetical protein